MADTVAAALRPFLGTWRLDPRESQYAAGAPPSDGAYTLSYNGVHLQFDIEWSGVDGTSLRQIIDAIPDGQEHPYAAPGVDSICYTLVNPVTLDSTAARAGEVVAHARRVILGDGSMEIVQSGRRPEGESFANRSLYRRAESGEQAAYLLIERFNRALNAHDVDGMLALMTAACVFENTWPPPDGERFAGQAAVAAFWRSFFAQSPAALVRIEELVVAGERAFQRWVYDWGAGRVRGVDLLRIDASSGSGRIAEKLSYVKG